MSDKRAPVAEETPVEDVRRVRERLSEEAGGDVRKLVEQSNQAFTRLKKKFAGKARTSRVRTLR